MYFQISQRNRHQLQILNMSKHLFILAREESVFICFPVQALPHMHCYYKAYQQARIITIFPSDR